MTEKVLICTVGGSPMYGTQVEADACRLEYGTLVRCVSKGKEYVGTLELVWFYDGPMYKVKFCGGLEKTFSFELGDHVESYRDGN